MTDNPTRHDNEPPLSERLAIDHQGLIDKTEDIAARANALPEKCDSDTVLGQIAPVIKAARALVKDVDETRKTEKEPFLTAGRDVDAFFAVMGERLNRIVKALTSRATAWQIEKDNEAQRIAAEQRRAAEAEEAKKRAVADAEAERGRTTSATKKTAEADAAADRAAEAAAAQQQRPAETTRVRTDDGIVATTTKKWAAEITDYQAIDLNELRPYFNRSVVEQALRGYVKTNQNDKPLAGVRIFADRKASFR